MGCILVTGFEPFGGETENGSSEGLHQIGDTTEEYFYLGRLADYGHLIIEKENSDKEIVYRYIQNPEDVQFILGNSKAYIAEYLKQ